MYQDRTKEIVRVTGRELLQSMRRLFDQANIVKLEVRRENGQELLSVPGGYGSLALLCLPRLSFLLLASCMVMRYEIIVHRESL